MPGNKHCMDCWHLGGHIQPTTCTVHHNTEHEQRDWSAYRKHRSLFHPCIHCFFALPGIRKSLPCKKPKTCPCFFSMWSHNKEHIWRCVSFSVSGVVCSWSARAWYRPCPSTGVCITMNPSFFTALWRSFSYIFLQREPCDWSVFSVFQPVFLFWSVLLLWCDSSDSGPCLLTSLWGQHGQQG